MASGSVAAAPTAPAADAAYAPGGFLRGWWLEGARVVWLAALAANVVCYISGMPRSFAIAATLTPAAVKRLTLLGLPATFTAWYLIVLDTITFALFVTAAVIIFRKRSADTLALTASFMLLFTGMLYTAPGYEARVPVWIVAAGAATAEFSQVAFLLIFPNGHFWPRWTWLILPPLALWRFYVWYVYYIPWLYAAYRVGDRYPFLRQNTIDLLLYFAVVLVAVALQVRRYRRQSTAAQRLQAKWLVWAVSVSVICVGAYVIGANALPALHPRLGSGIMLNLVGRTVRQAALCVVPLAILYAVLRRRLWDIDFLINRTLVYVPLTSLLAGIFAVLVVVSQRFFIAVTGSQSDWAIVWITLLLTMLVTPMRTEIQKWVDARFQEAPDPLRGLTRFDTAMRGVADVLTRDTLLMRLVDEVVRAFGATGGAAYRVEEGAPQLAYATRGWRGPIALQRPLIWAGECGGWLALGNRQSGAAYTEAEIKRLEETLARVAQLVVLMHGARRGATVPLAAADAALPLPAADDAVVDAGAARSPGAPDSNGS